MTAPPIPNRPPRHTARLLAVVWALFWVVAAFQPCVMAAGLGPGGGQVGADGAMAAPAGGESAAAAPCLHCELPDFQPAAAPERPQPGPVVAAEAPATRRPAALETMAPSRTDPPPGRTPTYLRLRVLRL